MKKRMLALSLAASFAMAGFAQNENMEAFKHLGVGLEVGVMGSGIQVSVPVVDNHLVAVVGFNSYALYGLDKINSDINLTAGRVNSGIDKLNREVANFNNKAENASRQIPYADEYLPESFSINLSGNINPNYKVLLEYYPSANSTFHITGGLMFGEKSFLNIAGTADNNVQRAFTKALEVQKEAQEKGAIAKTDDFITNNLSYTVDHKTYAIKDKVRVSADMQTMAIKPYLGLGFGRSIPNKRVGFQFEIGAWYHGKFDIVSDNEVEFDDWADVNKDVDDIVRSMKGICFWPQMTFRLTGRIF